MEGDRTRTLGGRTAAAVATSTSRSRDDAGAVLVLALMFLVVVGLIVGAMASWTANGLSNSLNFQQDRPRSTPCPARRRWRSRTSATPLLLGPNQTLNASPPSYCWGTSSYAARAHHSGRTPSMSGAALCGTRRAPPPESSRCRPASRACRPTLPRPPVRKNPGLQTIVTFDDYSASNPTINSGVACHRPTGRAAPGMTINSSTIKTTNPTVTALSVAARVPSRAVPR